MKRKRGNKGGRKKGKKVNLVKKLCDEPVPAKIEDNFGGDPIGDDQATSENVPEPLTAGADKLNAMSNMETEIPSDRSTGKGCRGRVKVKLKSSKILEPHRSNSDVQTTSETEKSNRQAAVEMTETTTEKEENTNSDCQTSELLSAALEKLPRKTGSIKIKSSRGLSFSNETMGDRNVNKPDINPHILSEKKLIVYDSARSKNTSLHKNLRHRGAKLPDSDPCYNEKELSAALVVIKKVMKMDAAVPFNVPVDPVALGIPDYFDVIDTPMDFGTICNNLEHGHKYMNSEDVYKDVQYIWDNCYTYNNKGDYIVDLMKRVKKNFMKHWLAAGLYSDMPDTPESIQMEDVIRPGQQKSQAKSKSKYKRRRYGIDKHKSDCLCAVCIVRRRRKEREENSLIVDIQEDVAQETKIEVNSPVYNSGSEDASSSLGHSPEAEANADIEDADNEEKLDAPDWPDSVQSDKQEKMETEVEGHHISSQLFPLENESEDFNQQSQEQHTEIAKDDTIMLMQQKKEILELSKHQQESSAKNRMVRMEEYPEQQENQAIFQICRSLFPSNLGSVWNSPHSIGQHTASSRHSSIHAAVATLMKE